MCKAITTQADKEQLNLDGVSHLATVVADFPSTLSLSHSQKQKIGKP